MTDFAKHSFARCGTRSRRTLCQGGRAAVEGVKTGLDLLLQVARGTPGSHLVVDLGHARLAVGLGLLAAGEIAVGLLGRAAWRATRSASSAATLLTGAGEGLSSPVAGEVDRVELDCGRTATAGRLWAVHGSAGTLAKSSGEGELSIA